jgi:hypothetical protein
MGQLADSIEKASAFDGPSITSPMLKEAATTLEEIIAATDDEAMKERVKTLSKGIGGIDTGTKSLLKALGWGAGLGIPAALIVGLLKSRAFESAEKRRKKLMREQLDIERAKRDLIVPPRETQVPIKAAMEKDAGLALPLAIVAGLLAPAGYKFIRDKLKGMSVGDAYKNLFRVTENPLTHPLGAPLILGLPVLSAGIANKLLNKRFEEIRRERMERERQEAEEEFRSALETEYSGSKVAGLAERIDLLADIYTGDALPGITARFTKQAYDGDPAVELAQSEASPWTGAGNKITGLYLAALLALTGAAGVGAWQYAKRTDPERKKSKALMRLARRRALATPPVLSVYRQEPLEEEEEREKDEHTLAEEPI